MKHVLRLRFAYSLTIEYSVARKASINYNLNSTYAMKTKRSHRMCISVFLEYNYLVWNPLCFQKNNMKITFTCGVGKPAILETRPPRKQPWGKLVSLSGLQIISQLAPVKLSGQNYFCSDISHFWPDNHRLRLISLKVPPCPLHMMFKMKQVIFQSIYNTWVAISMHAG